MSASRVVRVGFYGVGRFANSTHLPNLLQTEGVEIVGLSDANPEALAATARRVPGAHTYADAQAMVEREPLDALYSCVPAYVRDKVEIQAAQCGIHLFSEKPQALRMALARAIDVAIASAGVISTVGFRERYRPMFQQARRYLADKTVVHVQFSSVRARANPDPARPSWYEQMELSGGPALDWGVHAMDLVRYMTGLEATAVQAFYCQRDPLKPALSSSVNVRLTSGATMDLVFVSSLAAREAGSGPTFTIYYEGGRLDLHLYDGLQADGRWIFRGEDCNPWLAQDRAFISAIREGNPGLLLSDYHDGLYTLAPVLAGWESARRGGERIDVARFMAS